MKATIYLSTLLATALMTLPVATAQTVPPLMNYQGRLTDEAGNPLANGQYVLRFNLFDQAVGGESVWQEEQTVSLLGGSFNVVLGTVNPALATVFMNANRFLQLTVLQNPAGSNVNQTILPRQQLLSSPYSFMASSLIKELQDALCPPGTIVAFGGTNVPPGWLLCDGRALFQMNYPKLFDTIGTSWGAGYSNAFKIADFNLPDLRGMFLRGVSGTSTNDPNKNARTAILPGGNINNDVGSIQPDGLRSHSHPYIDYWAAGTDQGFGAIDSFGSGNSDALWQERDGRTTSATGGSETRPINAYVNYIIKY
ncbi:MAG: tail fiber protein [Verrucomicrobiae bacterium]|nr:tail fiber protein [Verrucomicrobiae bacterium]